MTTQSRDTLTRPEVAASGPTTVTIEHVRNHRIGADSRQRADSNDCLWLRMSAVLTAG